MLIREEGSHSRKRKFSCKAKRIFHESLMCRYARPLNHASEEMERARPDPEASRPAIIRIATLTMVGTRTAPTRRQTTLFAQAYMHSSFTKKVFVQPENGYHLASMAQQSQGKPCTRMCYFRMAA